jgi:hypothetical protein
MPGIVIQGSLFSSVIAGVCVHSGRSSGLPEAMAPELLAVEPIQLLPEEDMPPGCPVLATMITERGRAKV